MALSETEILILAAIGADELFGREIAQGVADITDSRRRLTTGGLYTTLHRMEKKGLIKGRWGDDTEAVEGARRRYYEVTASGHRALNTVRRALATDALAATGRA